MKRTRKYDLLPPQPGVPSGATPLVELENTMLQPGEAVPPPIELTAASPPLTITESASDWEQTCCMGPTPFELIPSGRQDHVSEPLAASRELPSTPRPANGFARVERLLRRVGRLPSADWQLVEMVFFRRMSPEQVGRAFGMTVEEMLRRYRAIMRRLSTPPGMRPPGRSPAPHSDKPAPEPRPGSAGGAA